MAGVKIKEVRQSIREWLEQNQVSGPHLVVQVFEELAEELYQNESKISLSDLLIKTILLTDDDSSHCLASFLTIIDHENVHEIPSAVLRRSTSIVRDHIELRDFLREASQTNIQ